MAYKFLTDKDFIGKVRKEILELLGEHSLVQLEVAENTALAQVKQYIGHRYDTVAIFAATGENRDAFIIDVVLNIMMYKLYVSKTGMKDIPEHRKADYQDTIDWLREVGNGTMNAMLPSLITDEAPGDVRLNSAEQQTWEY
jgi:phage gp36-like protein